MEDISTLMARLNANLKYRQFHGPSARGQIQATRYAAPLRESDTMSEEPQAPATAKLSLVRSPRERLAPAEPEIFFIEPRSDGRIIEPAGNAPRFELKIKAAAEPQESVAVVEPVAVEDPAVAAEPEIFFIAPRSEGGIIEPPRGALAPSAAPLRLKRPAAKPLKSSRVLADIFGRLQPKAR